MGLLLLELDTELFARERLDHFEITTNNFLVRGEQDDLVGSGGEVALDDVAAMMGVEAAKWGVDNEWDGPPGYFGESPENGRGKQLALASGERLEWNLGPGGVQQGDLEGHGVDPHRMKQLGLAGKMLEGLDDGMLQ